MTWYGARMAERDPYGWSGLTVEHLARLKPDEFEDFCFELIQCEAYERHDGPELEGPAGGSVADGGRDTLLTIKRSPNISKLDYQRKHSLSPLTEDHVGRTAYSCKASAKEWLDQALKDIQKERKEPYRPLEVLHEGGHFKLFINQVGKLDKKRTRQDIARTPKDHLVHAFVEQLKKLDASAKDPTDRIEIYDAQKLVRFLQCRMPVGGNLLRWSERFGIRFSLLSLDEWLAHHGNERDEPSFFDDSIRSTLSNQLSQFLSNPVGSSEQPIGWLIGPPGVGKTRLLLEILKRDPRLAQRVRVGLSPDQAAAVLSNKELLARHPDVVLIVDDCPLGLMTTVTIPFSAQAKNAAARLIVITPAGNEFQNDTSIGRKWYLAPLEQPSAQSLATNILGASADLRGIQAVVELSEGYPWFITLLAREMRAEQRPPLNIGEAVKWALASRHEVASEQELEQLRLRRARCLLAASLTRRIDWDKLSEAEETNIVRAVGLTHWQELKDTADQCFKRGLLRRNLNWQYKYVTPLVVEREIIAWLFDPNGPGPGPKTLNRYGHDFVGDFYEALERLGLSPSLLASVAQHDLVELQQIPLERDALQAACMLGPRIRFIGRHAPEQSARELHRRVMETSVDELRVRKDERRDFVFVFDQLSARRGTFDFAEEALFKLGLAENEAYVNNATRTWAQLFIPERNFTYRSTPERIDILQRRVKDPDPACRFFTLSGVEAVLTMHASRVTTVAFDGDWPTASAHEAHQERARVWETLATCFEDPDAGVAKRAKQVAILNLRSAFWTGVGNAALVVITDHADAFDDAERIKLRAVLTELRTYDTPKRDYVADALAKLEQRIIPASFRERLRQHVGTWRAAKLRKIEDDEAIDDELALEGLAGDMPIGAEIDWLLSDQAVRAHVFAFAMGRQDERVLLLDRLRARARAAGAPSMAKVVVARYLAGMKEAGRDSMADALLRQMANESEDAEIIALAVVELGATEERLAWIETALNEDTFGAACMGELGRRPHWLSAIQDARFAQFVTTLLAHTTVPRALTAVEHLVHATEKRPAAAETIKTLLLDALSQLAGARLDIMPGHSWELGAKFLVQHGEARRVAEFAVRTISRPEGSKEYAWNSLHEAAAREPLAAWQAVASTLSENTPEAGHLILAFMFHRSSFAWPLDHVLGWIGADERRGRTVVSLVPRGAAELDPILKGLVQRFGPHSSVANEIIARMHSTNGLVPSLADHDARHLAQARSWLADPEPKVQELAKRLVASFAESHAYHSAVEEDERRRWGT